MGPAETAFASATARSGSPVSPERKSGDSPSLHCEQPRHERIFMGSPQSGCATLPGPKAQEPQIVCFTPVFNEPGKAVMLRINNLYRNCFFTRFRSRVRIGKRLSSSSNEPVT